MRFIQTAIDIAAPPSRVWEILSDFSRYPEWNPFITSLSGQMQVGAKLKVHMKPPGKAGMTFNAIVDAAEPEREFRWTSKFLANGVLDGYYYFRLEPSGSGTRFQHGQRFMGRLVRRFDARLSATEQGFAAMNSRLKQRAEA
jgi:hypothetical protein